MAEILDMAVDALKTLVERFQTEFVSGRRNDAHALAHEIKGVCANIGAEELAQIAGVLQDRLAEGSREPGEALARSLPGAYHRFVQAAKAFLGR